MLMHCPVRSGTNRTPADRIPGCTLTCIWEGGKLKSNMSLTKGTMPPQCFSDSAIRSIEIIRKYTQVFTNRIRYICL